MSAKHAVFDLGRVLASSSPSRYALLLLNQPVLSESRFALLWKGARVRACVDGGANRWFEISMNSSEALPVPDLVTGDFDSIADATMQRCKAIGARVVPTPDQDRTDFTKAVDVLLQDMPTFAGEFDDVVAFVENSGRLDQIMANIETLFLKLDCGKRLYLMSSNSLSFLVPPGVNLIKVPREKFPVRPDCHIGLIPIGEPVDGVKTKGLRWNLDGNQTLAFGKLVSTSNALAEASGHLTIDGHQYDIMIENGKPLLLTIEL